MKPAQEILDGLGAYYGTESYHRFNPAIPFVVMTDGAKYVADECGAYWLMTLIGAAQLKSEVGREPFQCWTLKKTGPTSATLKATDGGADEDAEGNAIYKILVDEVLDYTDFPLDEITLWVEDGENVKVILLPSEH